MTPSDDNRGPVPGFMGVRELRMRQPGASFFEISLLAPISLNGSQWEDLHFHVKEGDGILDFYCCDFVSLVEATGAE